MNPQYFSHQQYGVPSQNYPNDGQNNQGFESVPLGPSNSNTPLNVPPTSVSSSNQLNNLLGKVPSGNLSPFTVLPQGHNMSGLDGQSQNVVKNMDRVGANNNIVTGLPRNEHSQTINGASHNNPKTTAFSIPPSQLPPGNLQMKPPGPLISQLPPSSASSFQHRTSPSLAKNVSFSATSQPNQTTPFQPISASNHSKLPTNVSAPRTSSNEISQNQSTSSIQSSATANNAELQTPTSQFNSNSNQHALGNDSNNPFVGSPSMDLTPSVQSEHTQNAPGIQLNQSLGSSASLASSGHNVQPKNPQSIGNQVFAASGHNDPAAYRQQPQTGQPPLPVRPLLPGQSPTSNQQLHSLQGQTQFSGQPPLPGQSHLLGKSPVASNFPGISPPSGQTSLPDKIPGQSSLPGLHPVSGQSKPHLPGQHMPGQPPLPGQQTPVQPPLSGQQMPGQPPLPGQQMSGQPPLPGQQMPGQPPLPGQYIPGQPPMPGQQMPGQSPMPGQQIPGQPPLPGQQISGQPPMPGQQIPGQPPLPGQQIPGQPPLPGQQMPGQPPLSGQKFPSQRPLPGQQLPGQPLMSNQNPYGVPPLPGQSAGIPPVPTQQSVMQGQQMFNSPQSFNQHVRSEINSFSPGGNPSTQYQQQLSNQMQNMSVSGSKYYSANAPTNGLGGPHMPPPINSQQMKSPGGYPPVQGQQPPMPPGVGGYQQQPGYPQPPGYPQHGYPQPGYQQQNQQKRLDPDQMPSPIQVTTDDQNIRSGVFVTNQKGLMPPLVTTNFIVQDQGNCSPRFIRSSMYNVAITSDMMKNTAVPFSLVISPLARLAPGEYSPPIVNFGELGPVRCVRCKAYMCPFMTFVDSGRRFQCAFCKATSDVPAEYFQHLDHTGQRMDRFERPELVLGTYEFMATADYCKTNVLPQVPAFIFVIDVSYNCMKSGLVRLLCSQMKEIIRNLPVDEGEEVSKMRVGFITYDNTVHFYNIKGTLAAPQMLVVGDIHEMFMPLLDGFLSSPQESEVIIDALMEQIPNMFAGTRQTETILLPAILAGVEALKASGCSGKLMVFSSNLPTVDAPGKLKNRDDRKLLGTDKERTILTPQNQAYNNLGQECVQAGVAVDLFLFNNSYIDIATIGQVSRISGGEVFKYTYFQADIDGERLIRDVITDISRPIGFDAIMRVRTSTGVRPTEFFGHFLMTNTTDMEIGSIDCDKAVAVEIKHDDKLHEDDGVYIQAALLYTSCSGKRRLRICNLSLKTCAQMTDLYRSCDLDTLINYWSKQALYKLMENNPKAVKDSIVSRAAQVLATYRKNCASPSSAGQLILPECMKLLPLYINCLLKSDALSGGSDMTIDERSFVMQACMTMDVPTSVYFFYPRLIPLHELDTTNPDIPHPIRCSIEKMTEHGVYILENGIHMFLWIGLGANPDFIQKLFGVPSAIQVNIEQLELPKLDNPVSNAVRNIIEEIRIQRHRHMRLTLVRQREKLEPVFKHFLVEDKGLDGSPSYVDFLCYMHKEIRSLLS